MIEREFFDDDEPSEEDMDAMEAQLEGEDMAKEEVVAELAPTPKPEAVPLELHAKSAATGGVAGYPTEDPGDPSVVWCPTPNTIGSTNQGFRTIKK